MSSFKVVVVAGPAGVGKTTVGQLLASQLGWEYHDGDDYHSAANVAKMSSGIQLSDPDRWPWLDAVHDAIGECLREGRGAVFSCSALRDAYRERLLRGLTGVALAFLHGSYEVILKRMEARQGHYMKAGMLRGQLDLVQLPKDGLVIDVEVSPEAAVRTIREHFGL